MAESSKPTITEFLLARIAEDEAVAQAAPPGEWCWFSRGMYDTSDELELRAGDARVLVGWAAYADTEGIQGEEPGKAHIIKWQPSRALAECAAKRAIIAAGITTYSNGEVVVTGCDTAYGEGQYCTTYDAALCALAAVYADHPDYDPRWAA